MKVRSTDHAKVGSTNKPLVVCLECHRTGVTIESNNQTTVTNDLAGETVGNYVVLDNLKFPLFQKEWSAREELLLLQGIMKCGMGNWIDISEQYVKTKKADECEEHYFTFYYKSKENNLPTNEEDCIINGPRIVEDFGSQKQINLPIDQSKAEYAEKRINKF